MISHNSISKISSTSARRVISNRLGVRIPRTTFYRMIEDGRIQSERVGSRIIVHLDEIKAFIERCRNGERF